LFSQGFEPLADVQRTQQDATAAARSLAVAALNSTRGAGMSLPSAASQQSLMQGYAEAKPERTISYGGQQLAMRETPTERQDRLARGEEMRKRQSAEETARVATRAKTAEQERLNELAAGALRGGPKSPEAVRLALENPSAYKAIYDNAGQMTEYQRAMLGLSRERLDYERTRQTAQDKPTPVPASDRRAMTELEASVKELDKALKAVDDSPQAFGLKTMLPNPLLSRQAGVKPRADVTGAIVKLRRTEFGTALSRQEAESGVSLFPAIGGLTGGDNADAIRDKLTALKEKAMLELNAKREFYGMPAVAPGSAAQPAAPAQAKAPSAAPAGRTLEQEFPGREAQIKAARGQGYSDADIRAFLARGR
jgi:hypothetical protein